MTQRILLVEDDARLAGMVSEYLAGAGFRVTVAGRGEAGIERLAREPFDALVLDLMLPDIDGLEVCRRVRSASDVPILMLTARDTELDKVVGLELGADDYLAKPFSTRELVARVRALLRRTRPTVAPVGERLESAGLLLDAGRHRVTLEGSEIALKPKEFDLLAFFMGHPGQVFGREQLLASVWGYDFAGDSRTVDTHVKTLREKLGDDAEHPRWIDTVRGVGYRFRESSPA